MHTADLSQPQQQKQRNPFPAYQHPAGFHTGHKETTVYPDHENQAKASFSSGVFKSLGRVLPVVTAADRVLGESFQGRTSGISRPDAAGKGLPAPD